jgi:cytochrome c peroxidase
MTAEKVALGRLLFYEKRLSVNGTTACASCHEQARGFSDGKALPKGATDDQVPRNAMPLANAAYLYPYTWANPLLETLEQQALVPLTADAPLEMGLHQVSAEVMQLFADDATYARAFRSAFPEEKNPFQVPFVARAIAAFERTLLSFEAPLDRFNRGETEALSESAKRGMELFFSERAECYHCHVGLNMTTALRTADTAQLPNDFQNNGLFNVGGAGVYPSPNEGIILFSGNPRDMGRFRVPPLRNVTVTAPYMHDGSMRSLREVIDHYVAGGRNIESGPHAGDGRKNPFKSNFVREFALADSEKADLLAFLESMTDETFLTDPAFSNPFDP